MDHLPSYEFQKCVARYRGDAHGRGFSCRDQYLAMAFAQLTYRESLRDIEACLRSMRGKLYHMGFRGRVARATLADANERHDWRIYADFAQVLIGIARPLYGPQGTAAGDSRRGQPDAARSKFRSRDTRTPDCSSKRAFWELFGGRPAPMKQHSRAGLPQVLFNQAQIEHPVRRREEDPLPVGPPLRDVVRKLRRHGSRVSGHILQIVAEARISSHRDRAVCPGQT